MRRRKYDSSRPFDDDIPKESECDGLDDETFYETFAEVFKRNAKWSTKQPVPELPEFKKDLEEGTEEHDKYIKKVQAFYRFL